MSELRSTDLRGALDLVRSLSAADGTAQLRRMVAPQLRGLIGADHASYDDLDLAANDLVQFDDPEDFIVPNLDWLVANLFTEHPLVNVIRRGERDVVQISDVMDRRAWHRHPLYVHSFGPTEREHTIVAGLGGPASLFGAVALSREHRGFSERERQLLSLIRPHLARARSDALLRDALAAQEEGEGAFGVVVLSSALRIGTIDGRASALLARYFGVDAEPGVRLPERLEAWTREQLARLDPWHEVTRRPLGAWNGQPSRGRLRVRLLPAETEAGVIRLVLEEEAGELAVEDLTAVGLTRRQAEVLRLAARGLIDEAIGHELSISARTVHKHFQHIHARLGVGTRTAAIARAREALGP